MKNTNRKLIALLMAVMMMLSLAACGSKAPADAPDESPAVTESAAPEAAQEAAEAPSDEEAEKNITVTVIHGDESRNVLEITTKAENLREALEPEGIIAGDDSEFGLFVKTVDGETADDSQQQWWAVTKDGEMAETGVDGIVINDGDSYEFTLTTGW